MNYGAIKYCDIANGTGVLVTKHRDLVFDQGMIKYDYVSR